MMRAMLSPSFKNAIATGNDYNELQSLVGPSNIRPLLDSCPLSTAADFDHFFGEYGIVTHALSGILLELRDNYEQIRAIMRLTTTTTCSTTFSAIVNNSISPSSYITALSQANKTQTDCINAVKESTASSSYLAQKIAATQATKARDEVTNLQTLRLIIHAEHTACTVESLDASKTEHERAHATAQLGQLNQKLNQADARIEEANDKLKTAVEQKLFATAIWHKHILNIRAQAKLQQHTLTSTELCHAAKRLQLLMHNGTIESHTYNDAFINAHPEQLATNERGEQLVIEPQDLGGDGIHFMRIRRVGALQDQIEKSAGNSNNRMQPPSNEYTKALAVFLRKVTQLACNKAILAQSQSCVSLLSRTYRQLRPTTKQRYRDQIIQLQLQLNQLLHASDPSIKAHQKLAALISLCQQAHLRIESGKSKFSRFRARLLHQQPPLNRRQTAIDALATQLKQLHKAALPAGENVTYTPENLKRVQRAYQQRELQSKLHTPLQIYRARKARNHSATRIQALSRGVLCRQRLLDAPFLNPINKKADPGTIVSHRDIAVAPVMDAASEFKP